MTYMYELKYLINSSTTDKIAPIITFCFNYTHYSPHSSD